LTVPFPAYGFGAAKRRGPTGGTAYGTPRYSETWGIHADAWPSTAPLLVATLLPTDHATGGGDCGAAAAAAAAGEALLAARSRIAVSVLRGVMVRVW
jgi:hypothetical protein